MTVASIKSDRTATYPVLSLADLERLHPLVEARHSSWRFYQAAYEGTEALIKREGVLPQNPRESNENYAKRLETAYGFGYSQAVVDLLVFYLFQQPALHDWGAFADDPLFLAMLQDADYLGTDLDMFLIEAHKSAAIQGHSGILVDKPQAGSPANNQTVEDVTTQGIYPYLSLYAATNILDWKFERNEQGRPVLTYLKLLDDDVDTARDITDIHSREARYYAREYRIWTPTYWQLYKTEGAKTWLLDEGPNPIGVVPFTWVFNSKSSVKNIGVSDLKEVARIDASIIRNLSQVEEVTEYAAFPMLMKPEQPPGQEEDDTVGVTAVLEFDPTNPNALPSWLEAAVKDPVDAIFNMIYRKVEEIYRSINAGGLNSTEVTRQVKSGIALQQEFRLLNAKLATKSALLEEAERQVLLHWASWQDEADDAATIKIQRPRDFNISDLLQELETVVLATSIVNSPSYDQQMQKLVVRKTLPDVENYTDIDSEIESYEPPRTDNPGEDVTGA